MHFIWEKNESNFPYAFHHHGVLNNAYVHVHMTYHQKLVEIVKDAFLQVASNLCVELTCKFHDAKTIVALGMVYLQSWLCEEVVVTYLDSTSS